MDIIQEVFLLYSTLTLKLVWKLSVHLPMMASGAGLILTVNDLALELSTAAPQSRTEFTPFVTFRVRNVPLPMLGVLPG